MSIPAGSYKTGGYIHAPGFSPDDAAVALLSGNIQGDAAHHQGNRFRQGQGLADVPPEEQPSWTLYGAAVAGSLCAGMGGFIFGYTSPLFTNDCLDAGSDGFAGDHALSLNCQLQLSVGEKALTASIPTMGGLTGSLIAGWLVDKVGRRAGLCIAATLYVLGWLSIAMCDTLGSGPGTDKANALGVALLIGGRGVTGIGMGIANLAYPLYVAEASPAQLRGFLSAGGQFGANFSCMCEHTSNLLLLVVSRPALTDSDCL